jgi:hypothetical protein
MTDMTDMSDYQPQHGAVSDGADEVKSDKSGAPAEPLIPWSFKLPVGWKIVISCVSAVIVMFIGTAISRSGAQYFVPWGLLVGFVLIFASSWSARARGGFMCSLFHFIVTWICVWLFLGFIGYGPGEVYPMLLGSVEGANFLMQNSAFIWIGGLTVIQVVVAFLPKKFFVLKAR